MKSTSTDAPPRPGDDAPVRVRPARLDQQLSTGFVDPVYADAHLERLVERAHQQAVAAGRAQGYAQGLAAGSRTAEENARRTAEAIRQQETERAQAFLAQATSALTALSAAGEALRQTMTVTWEEIGDRLFEGAMALARATLARELASVDAEVAEAVRTALRTVGTTTAEVRVHPEDLHVLATLPEGSLPDGIRLVADRGVPRSGAVAVDGFQQVLAHFPSALAAAQEVLRP